MHNRQGSLGDCWLLSAIISLTVLRPDMVIKIFHPKSRKANQRGYYHLRFFFNGSKKEISIDDQFPCDGSVFFVNNIICVRIGRYTARCR